MSGAPSPGSQPSGGWVGWVSQLRLVSHPLLEEMLPSPLWTGEPGQRSQKLLSCSRLVGALWEAWEFLGLQAVMHSPTQNTHRLKTVR